MRVISSGNKYITYDDNMRVYEELPTQVYSVRFSKLSGFYLEKHSDIEISESKVYGIHNAKMEKVFKAFAASNRSLGVIMSGAKGIGKSLFAKMLCRNATSNGTPVLIVDQYVPGIASYLESIEQEVLVMFDEFEKTFGKHDGEDPQNEMLSLFDGFSAGKKMYVITCNNLYNLNDFLVNRPGRFHYHLRFDYPIPDEIREYMTDKLDPEHHGEIQAVVNFAAKMPMNYDCLRAIAFEINLGYTFKEAIQDLNILKTEEEKYNVMAVFGNGATFQIRNCRIDMFDPASVYDSWMDKTDNSDITLNFKFCSGSAEFSMEEQAFIIGGAAVNVTTYHDATDEKEYEEERRIIESGLKYIIIKREVQKDLHYMV